MTVLMWFYPVRLKEFQGAYQWFRENGRQGHEMRRGRSRWFLVPQGVRGSNAYLHEDGWLLKQSDSRVSRQPILTDQGQHAVAAGPPDLEKQKEVILTEDKRSL